MVEKPVEFYERAIVLSILRFGMGGRFHGIALYQLRVGVVVYPLIGDPSGKQCTA